MAWFSVWQRRHLILQASDEYKIKALPRDPKSILDGVRRAQIFGAPQSYHDSKDVYILAAHWESPRLTPWRSLEIPRDPNLIL